MEFRMIRLFRSARFLAIVLVSSAAAFGVLDVRAAIAAPAASEPARNPTVTIRMFAFAPQVLTVAPGTTVTWTNADDDPHTVTANDKSFHSAALDTNGTFHVTFTKPGDYAYFCSLHPHMTGRIVVKAD
jgi:plastocyanin